MSIGAAPTEKLKPSLAKVPRRESVKKKAPVRRKRSGQLILGRLFDARPDRLDFRDLRYAPSLRSLEARFPTTEHLAEAVSSYVKANLVLDQGKEGACTGFGLAAVVNYLLWLRELGKEGHKQEVHVSPHMLYELARRYDEWEGESYEGSSCRGALKGFHKHGVCQERYWPATGKGAAAVRSGTLTRWLARWASITEWTNAQ